MAPFVEDTFTEGGGGANVVLSAHTGEVGATWTEHAVGVDNMEIVKALDAVQPVGGFNAKRYLASGTPGSADYTVTAVFRRPNDGLTHTTEVWARHHSTDDTGYVVGVGEFTTPSEWYLGKHVSGSDVNLDSFQGDDTVNTDYTVVWTLDGTDLSVTINGVARLSASDSDVTAAGLVGVGGFAAGGSGDGFFVTSISAEVLGGGGTTQELAATIASSGAIVAALRVEKPLAASIASTSTVTAALNSSSAKLLAATISGSSAISAALRVPKRLGATIAGTSSVAAALTVSKRLAASIASTSAVAAALNVSKPLAASIASTSSLVARLTVGGAVAAGNRVYQSLQMIRTRIGW